MELNGKIRFSTKKYTWLCFRHAVFLSLRKKDVEVDFGDYDSEYYIGTTICNICSDESEKNDEIGRLHRHYSGSKSMEFWDIINKVDRGKTHSEKFQRLYHLGVKLQNLEADVLNMLAKEES